MNSKDNPFPRYPDAKIILNQKVWTRDLPGRVFVVEFPPNVRPILDGYFNKYEPVLRQLAFPYVYLVILILKEKSYCVYVFYRNSPLAKYDQQLFESNLPNVWEQDSQVCMDALRMKEDESIEEFVGRVVEEFWSSAFCNELSNLWAKATEKWGHPWTFAEWERLSSIDPKFILKVQWNHTFHSLDSLDSFLK